MTRLVRLISMLLLVAGAGDASRAAGPTLERTDVPPYVAPSIPTPESTRVYLDARGDAVMRRTDDLSEDIPFVPPKVLPDILRLSISGWAPDDPAVDPYTGAVVAAGQADLFRLDLVIDGLVNPPGLLGFGAGPFDPFRFGDRPLYGFIEIDIDADANTGGDLGSNARSRFLGNVARFNSVALGSLAARTAKWGWENDQFFFSHPQIERSGAEFEIAMCGCFDVEVVDEGGDGDGIFGAGETWLVRSRYFRRSSGYSLASGSFGGSQPGHYDPWNILRFSHDPMSDETTVSLVYPLTHAGAAALADEPEQFLNLDVSDHTSIVEGMLDVIETLMYKSVPDPSATLAAGWAGADPMQFLDPSQWTATALVAATYANQRTAAYIYTDVGFNIVPADLDGDGAVTQDDRTEFAALLGAADGSANDGDGQANSKVTLEGVAANFSLCDMDQDGVVNASDLSLIDPGEDPCPADLDGNGDVGSSDLALILGSWGVASSSADLDGDGVVGSQDLALLLGQWGPCPTS